MIGTFSLLAVYAYPALADEHCDDRLGCVEVGLDDPIVVGAMLVVSGAVSYLNEDSLSGIEFAILHRDGALLGREIELVVEDSLCTAEGGQAAAQRLSADESLDVIYLPLFEPEANFFVAQMQHFAGLEGTTIIGGGASFVAGFPENTGEAAIGVYVSDPLVSGTAYDEFLADWDTEIGGTPPSGYHAHAYDATNILLEAVTRTALVLNDGSILIGRSSIREALEATEDYAGLTGNLTCLEESPFAGDCATGTGLAMFVITEAEVYDDNWPPPVAWNFAAEAGE